VGQTFAQNESSILIATLGSEAQVVTAALDLLRAQGQVIPVVRVVHTFAPGSPVAAAVERLQQAFADPFYHERVRMERIAILDAAGRPVADVDSPSSSECAFRTIYRQILLAKRAGQRVHLCIAGGRKTMALYALAAAQMLCDEDDHLWHLFSSGEFLASKRFHPRPGDSTHLVEIPFIVWSAASPALSGLSEIEDPFEALGRIRELQLGEKLAQIRSYLLGSLTPAEGRVVGLLASEGLSDQQIASRLTLSPRTVEQHLRSAYQKAAAHWDIDSVGRTQLARLVGLVYSFGYHQKEETRSKIRENPDDKSG